MTTRRRRTAPWMVALGLSLVGGCGPAPNEENITGRAEAVPHKEGTPEFKSYAEYQTYQTEQRRKERPAGKDRKAKRSSEAQ